MFRPRSLPVVKCRAGVCRVACYEVSLEWLPILRQKICNSERQSTLNGSRAPHRQISTKTCRLEAKRFAPDVELLRLFKTWMLFKFFAVLRTRVEYLLEDTSHGIHSTSETCRGSSINPPALAGNEYMDLAAAS